MAKMAKVRISNLYLLALLIAAGLSLFAGLSYWNSPGVEAIDYASILFEGFLAVLPIFGLFLIVDLYESSPRSYLLLFVGLTMLAISMVTDTMDEIVILPDIYNFLFEGIFQVVGFLLLLTGLKVWVDWITVLNTNLNQLATTDYLTGAANRRHFMNKLKEQIDLCRRYHNQLSLVLLDIDFFKHINDAYGHSIGDEKLVKVAELIRSNIRSTDLLARYGGEEFIILVPHAEIQGAQQLAEKIRTSLEETHENDRLAVTASLGVAQYTANESIESFLNRTDAALYNAKEKGRNQVILANAPSTAV